MIADRIQTYLDNTIPDLIKSYDEKGLRASGQYADELKATVVVNGTKIRATITGPIQSIFMEDGRGPNRDTSHQAVKNLGWYLKQWVADKGIDVNPYAAAHKIVNEGIQVPNPHNPGGVVSDVIDDNWFDQLNRVIGLDVVQSIQSDVLKQFKAN